MTITITEPTADETTKLIFAKRLRTSNSADLQDNTKYAIVLVQLAGAVTPADYPTLKADITAITGIQDVDLLIDHQTRETVPVDHTQVLQISANVRLRDDTPVE